MALNDAKYTYLVGIGVTHSVAPTMHDEVARQLNRPWTFKAQECASIEIIMKLFRDQTFAGGVVTMPYKVSIMPHLDSLDDHAKLIGACNNVYRSSNGSLTGTNTDWRGIQGCLESGTDSKSGREGQGKPALIIGAGGASRAALYTLSQVFNCSPVYIVNRDENEVLALLEDGKKYEGLEMIHLTTVGSAMESWTKLGHPYFVVGTVPDLEPQSPEELEARDILKTLFGGNSTKGVVLDMCFKPRNTRTLKMARECGWSAVEGVDVIGYQIEEQYRLWTGLAEDSPVSAIIQEKAWEALHAAANASTAINT